MDQVYELLVSMGGISGGSVYLEGRYDLGVYKIWTKELVILIVGKWSYVGVCFFVKLRISR